MVEIVFYIVVVYVYGTGVFGERVTPGRGQH